MVARRQPTADPDVLPFGKHTVSRRPASRGGSHISFQHFSQLSALAECALRCFGVEGGRVSWGSKVLAAARPRLMLCSPAPALSAEAVPCLLHTKSQVHVKTMRNLPGCSAKLFHSHCQGSPLKDEPAANVTLPDASNHPHCSRRSVLISI